MYFPVQIKHAKICGECAQNNYYDFQLSKVREKIGHKLLTFKLPSCQGQLALFPRVTA